MVHLQSAEKASNFKVIFMVRLILLVSFFFLQVDFLYSQPIEKNLTIQVFSGTRFDVDKLVILSDSGLFIQDVHEWFFLRRFPRKKKVNIFLPIAELSPQSIYRIQAFVTAHNCLKDLNKLIPEEAVTDRNTRIINVQCREETINIACLISNSKSDTIDNDMHFVNELLFLLNDLIPEKYQEFQIKISQL